MSARGSLQSGEELTPLLMSHSGAPYTYDLPRERIAQRPAYPYDTARLLVVSRSRGVVADTDFRSLPNFVKAPDCLVFNDSAVIPARLFGVLAQGGAGVEMLLLTGDPLGGRYRALAKPMRKLKVGAIIRCSELLEAAVIGRDEFTVEVQLAVSSKGVSISDAIDQCGSMPIPPYIRDGVADATDRTDYQPPFAAHPGSVAASTASLHFTKELLTRLAAKGVQRACVTLHLGTASFQPVIRDGELRPPAAERYQFPVELSSVMRATKESQGRVIAVGTSVVRALETYARMARAAGGGETDLFIQPGFSFEMVDAVVTNFHQPGTTHLLLVESFLGRALLDESYRYALEHGFRFLSYGDGMLLVE